MCMLQVKRKIEPNYQTGEALGYPIETIGRKAKERKHRKDKSSRTHGAKVLFYMKGVTPGVNSNFNSKKKW